MKAQTRPLTNTIIEGLPPAPPGKRTMYYDAKTPHLVVRVSHTGHKAFVVYRGFKGRILKRTLGTFPTMSLEQARLHAGRINATMNEGIDPRDEKRAAQEEPPLGELFEHYLNYYAKDHCKTYKVMRYYFNRYLGPWRLMKVSGIRKADVQRLHSDLGTSCGHTTANRTIQLMSAIVNKAINHELISGSNPAAGISKFKLKPRDRFVQAHELPRLIAALVSEPNGEIRDFVSMAISTGARKTNILQMRWRDLDLEGGIWLIPDTKNGTAQTILLTESELALLKERFDTRRSLEWVFPGPDPKKPLMDPKKGWQRILDKAGIANLHIHDLRRTLGSYMAMTGASLSVIGNALNHKDLSTTRKVYACTAHEAERAARLIAHGAMKLSAASTPPQPPQPPPGPTESLPPRPPEPIGPQPDKPSNVIPFPTRLGRPAGG